MEKSRKFSQAAAGLALLLMIAVIGGCGIKKDSSNNMNTRSYGHDGYLGISNSNPHLPNRNGNDLNYGSDGNFAERKLKEIRGVADYTIIIQGPKLKVAVKAARNVDPASLEREVLSTLQANMPRYEVSVTTMK
ncbi:hypothetical protein [Paenibacillus nasutitermitis]|uniref:Sporulation protein n=1 Tax=Paenibacillus nasutitermitis TaxID=1652958 RepID=A0A916ZG40_9BACL|nr:hypothetical protein [Paenibacillus nasutitermitis]GGD95593.1 hypothetical protein GCM10010911_62810 [Paenibacillus nasutitermitis]